MPKQVTVYNQLGFTLIETIIAAALFAIVSVGAMSLTSYMVTANQDLSRTIEALDLQSSANISFSIARDPLTCNQRILTPLGAPLTLPVPQPGSTIAATKIAIAMNRGLLLVSDGETRGAIKYSVSLAGKWNRTIPKTLNDPKLERFFAYIQIQTASANSAQSLETRPIRIPVTFNVEALTGKIYSCTSHSTLDEMLNGAHSLDDCIKIGGAPVYNKESELLCKFSLQYLDDAPVVTCPSSFKTNPNGALNCVPNPITFPLTDCADFPDGSEGDFCAVNAGTIYPAGNTCSSMGAGQPASLTNAAYCTSTESGPKNCAEHYDKHSTPCKITVTTVTTPDDGSDSTVVTTSPDDTESKISTTTTWSVTTDTDSGPVTTTYTKVTTTTKVCYQRCNVRASVCDQAQKMEIFWDATFKPQPQYDCRNVEKVCPHLLDEINPAPNLTCEPILEFDCFPGELNCLKCPKGWIKTNSDYSGITQSDGLKLVESITCY